jgi:T-complex protein 1 subunit alpha
VLRSTPHISSFYSYIIHIHTSPQFLGGTRESGEDVRNSNVMAAIAVANIVRSSLGPTGLDKMLVNDIGDVIVTNDGATILKQIDVEHPAAQLLVDLAQLQDQEVGDGTTSVVLIAAELLRRANMLIQNNLHPTTVISGYRVALKAAIAFIKQSLIIQVSSLTDTHLLQAARTSMSSKLIGKEGDYFAQLAVDAVKSIKTIQNGKEKYPLSAIHILKAHGRSSIDSQLIQNGFAIQGVRAAQGMPTHINGTEEDPIKIALLDMNLQRHRMGMGISVQVTDPKEIENIKQREIDITRQKIQKILETGAKVILTTKGIDDICMKYFVEAGALCARRCNKDDLKRLAKATGGKVVTTMADMDGEESFDVSVLGTCMNVEEVRIGDGEMIHFDQTGIGGSDGASTIILRGANEYMLDEMDRALHDALCVVKRMLESNTLVPGGGAVEAAISVYLEQYSCSLETREQLAIQEFAEAVMIIPKTLAVNAAKDSSDLIAKLRAVHAKSQKVIQIMNENSGKNTRNHDDLNYKNYGLDLLEGTVRDNLFAGVVEPAMSKIKSLRFATEAAITILRIDDRITVNKDQQQH